MTTAHASAVHDPRRAATGYTNGEVGVLLFLATEVMLFAGLVAAVLVLRAADRSWSAGPQHLSIGAGAAGTALLAASALALGFGLARARRPGGERALRGGLALAALFGAGFVALQAFEYRALLAEGFTWRSGPFGSAFFVLTGLHGAHVLAGVAWNALLALRSPTRPNAVHAARLASWYGYLVDGVWVVLFALFYLV